MASSSRCRFIIPCERPGIRRHIEFSGGAITVREARALIMEKMGMRNEMRHGRSVHHLYLCDERVLDVWRDRASTVDGRRVAITEAVLPDDALIYRNSSVVAWRTVPPSRARPPNAVVVAVGHVPI
jgi:hypothetical protein